MMGRFAFTESMGRYSLPKQLDNIITRKVRIKVTHQVQYHKLRKKQGQQNTEKPSPFPSYHHPPTHTPPTLHLLLFLFIH